MDVLKLRVPPPAVALTFAVFMWSIAQVVPTLRFALPARHAIAACVAVTGFCVAIAGVVAFHRARTTVNPLRPEKASSLVVSGIYKLTRNPMYLGLLLVLVAWALVLSNALSVMVVPAFILYMNRFQIEPEEAALTSAFGTDFMRYEARVRRWL